MARRDRTPQRSFTGGEQSPNLDARGDLPSWKSTLSILENFVIQVTGGVTRRSGLRDINQALAASTLIPFAFAADDGYAIECAPGVCRFYRDFQYLLNDAGTIFELVTPFAADEIANLRYAQSADVMYLTTGARLVQRLARVAASNWTIGDAAFKNGPFMPENADETSYLYTDHDGELTKGTVFNLKKKGAALFQPGHVGSLWLIRERDGSEYGRWQANADDTFGLGAVVRWVDNIYKCDGQVGEKSGNNPPVHLYGSQWDGVTATEANWARRWLYLHSGYGVLKITGYTDAHTVEAMAQSYIPHELFGTLDEDEVLTGGTWRWAEGAFSDVRGYPRLALIHKKRLYLASTTAQPTTIWASVIDDYPNFDAQSVLATTGFTETLEADTGRVNIPQWLVSGKRMGIGTSGDEHVLDSVTPGEPVKPDTVDVTPATSEGSAAIPAIKIDGPVFISKDGRRIHELSYDYASDSFVAPEITLLADHMSGDNGGKFLGLAWQRDPYRLLYSFRDDGMLVACTYRKDQEVKGWHRHPTIKGKVESICCVPSPTGTRQDMWAIVTRTCAGGTSRRIESLMPFFEQGDRDVTKAFFADGAVFYDGAPATQILNIPAHLNGEAVAVLADGKVVRNIVVAAGKITLPFAASKVIVGLPLTGLLKTLRFDRDFYGALSDDRMQVRKIVVDAIRSAAIETAVTEDDFELLIPSAGGVMDAAAALKDGPFVLDAVPSDWDVDGQVSIRCASPLPATIRAITPDMQVST